MVEKKTDLIRPAKLSRDDKKALRKFCQDIEIDDIKLEDWSAVHDRLDLDIFVYLTKAEQTLGGTKELSYSVTHYSHHRSKREKQQILISWDPMVELPKRVKIEGRGDRRGLEIGALYVILQRSPNEDGSRS